MVEWHDHTDGKSGRTVREETRDKEQPRERGDMMRDKGRDVHARDGVGRREKS